MHICGVASHRPDFYPPAYEESLDAEKQDCPTGRGHLGFPPPLYTATSLELEDENDPQPEAPPPYQESIADTAVTAKAWGAEGPNTALRAGTALQPLELTSSREERLARDWEGALPPCTGSRPVWVPGTHV